jgi:4-amino-4-deoxy-L-arabinose transferase-like glycosyltransferase
MKKIYIILLITVLARILHVSYPVTGWHSWRQSDTASIARNFYENGHSLLYPQINWGGNKSGFVESEFPVYPFIVSYLYDIFGVHDAAGRWLSLLFSVLTVYGVYLLVRKIINEDTALWSAFIYAVLPLNIFYGRAFMPDTFMLMCSVYSVYFFCEWLDKNNTRYFIFTVIFTALAILLKLPAMYMGLPLFYLAYTKYGLSLFKKSSLYLLTALIFIPVVLWYYHAHQLLLNNGSSFGIWTFGQDKWGTFALLADIAWYNDIFFKSIAERHLTYAGFVLTVWGLFVKRKNEREGLFDIWMIAVLIFIFIAAQAHRAQEYYSLPINIPAAVFAGKVLAKYLPFSSFRSSAAAGRYRSYMAMVCVILICVLSYLRTARFLGGESQDAPAIRMGTEIQSATAPGEKIVTICDGNPVYLYHARRFGWTAQPQEIDSAFVSAKKNEGAKVLAGEKEIFIQNGSADKIGFLLNNYKVIKNENDFLIIRIN